MALTKNVSIDKIEVIENGIVQVRQATKIIEDGQEISLSYHRWSLTPGQDVLDQNQRVQNVCLAVWTSDVIQAYKSQPDKYTSAALEG